MADNLLFFQRLLKVKPVAALDWLHDIHHNPWAELPEDRFGGLCETLSEQLSALEGVDALLWLHLLGNLLTRPEQAPPWAEAFLTSRRPPDLSWPLTVAQMRAGRWSAVPLWLVQPRQVCRRWMLAGLGPWPEPSALLPEWAAPLMDADARSAVADAVTAALKPAKHPPAPGSGFLIFPILPLRSESHIVGRSHGLALALACLDLLEPGGPPHAPAASGDVAPDGRIGQVHSVAEKATAAADHGYRAFICPAEDFDANRVYPLEMLPAATIEDARMLAGLHEPGNADLLLAFKGMFFNPARLVDNCLRVPPEWLRWMHDQGCDRQLAQALVSEPDLLTDALRQFEQGCLKSSPACPEMSCWLTPADLEPLTGNASLTVFKWAVMCLATANHAGRIEQAAAWGVLADRLSSKLVKSHLKEVVDYDNHLFIDRYHNHYTFTQDLPAFIGGALQKLEALYQAECALSECPVNRELGALYGSLGQNCAFQGSQCLQDALAFFEKARGALGEPMAETADDWRRQYNYQAYALLDAGRLKAAKRAVWACLGISAWHELRGRLGRLKKYDHALLARCIADTGDTEAAAVYLPQGADRAKRLGPSRHPWQLWHYNMGRIHAARNDPEKARAFFEKSLALCLDPAGGPTIEVMALLPLAGLWGLGRFPRDSEEKLHSVICNAMAQLDTGHFTQLNTLGLERMAALVAAAPHRWFPFSYR